MTGPFLNWSDGVDRHHHHLPHWQQGQAWQFVTWRLADSLPADKLAEWRSEREAWLLLHPKPWDDNIEAEYHAHFTERMDGWLDAGHGNCTLRDRQISGIVENALRFFDGARYGLGPFVIMPNHVHLLFQPAEEWPLDRTLHSWKSFTAKEVNKLRGTTGAFWQEDYWDRIVRSENEWIAYRDYITQNPKYLKPETYVLACGSKKSPT